MVTIGLRTNKHFVKTKLELVPVYAGIPDPQPAAFHEAAAAKYIGMCRTKFREIVKEGLIPFAEHMNGQTRIYLRYDLDAYLKSLEWRTMVKREVSPVVLREVIG